MPKKAESSRGVSGPSVPPWSLAQWMKGQFQRTSNGGVLWLLWLKLETRGRGPPTCWRRAAWGWRAAAGQGGGRWGSRQSGKRSSSNYWLPLPLGFLLKWNQILVFVKISDWKGLSDVSDEILDQLKRTQKNVGIFKFSLDLKATDTYCLWSPSWEKKIRILRHCIGHNWESVKGGFPGTEQV